MSTKALRIAVIEDSPEFLASITSLLSEIPDIVFAGSAATAEGALELLRRAEPDLVLLDVYLQRGTGMDVLKDLSFKRDHAVIAVMTNAPSSTLERCCLELGAKDFVDKADIVDWLPKLIELVKQSMSVA